MVYSNELLKKEVAVSLNDMNKNFDQGIDTE
ncbi:MAG: hypothetical protein ACI955_001460 [Zhongshania sp.]|jgi:hypothetical protein